MNIGRRKTFRSFDFFRNEINFYREILPRMLAFQSRHGVAPASELLTELPRCLAAHCDGETDFLALEDLRPDGYRAASRQDGLDLAHCRMIIRALGKFHAMTLAIRDQEPELLKEILQYIEVRARKKSPLKIKKIIIFVLSSGNLLCGQTEMVVQ